MTKLERANEPLNKQLKSQEFCVCDIPEHDCKKEEGRGCIFAIRSDDLMAALEELFKKIRAHNTEYDSCQCCEGLRQLIKELGGYGAEKNGL